MGYWPGRHAVYSFLTSSGTGIAGLQPSVTATLTEMHTLPHANATTTDSLDQAVELAGNAAGGG